MSATWPLEHPKNQGVLTECRFGGTSHGKEHVKLKRAKKQGRYENRPKNKEDMRIAYGPARPELLNSLVNN